MAEHRKEGRLSEDEAHEDIERLNVAAREANLPLLDDLSRIEDVRALEQMLEDAGLYTGPTVSDAIELGSQVSLDILASQARDKEPLEIHYQERIIEAVRSMFRERFGMDVPPFPTERIFLLEDAMFDRVVEQRSATFFPAHEPKMIHGLFDSRNAIILVRHRECDPLAERLQVTAHELTHWALHAQPRHNTASLLAFRLLFEEGITEQVALETFAPLLAEPDLIESARKWMTFRELSPPEHPTAVVPTLERVVGRDEHAMLASMWYGYPLHRYLIEDIARTVHEDVPDHGDLLRIFVDAVVNRDIGPLKRLVRSSYGPEGARLLFERGGKPLDVAARLHQLRRVGQERDANAEPGGLA